MLATSRMNRARSPFADDVDVLGDVGAGEPQRVDAGSTFDGVAAVAGIPLEQIVAGAEQGGVVAPAAGHEVVAVAADQRIVARAADDGVVAGAAIDGQLDDPCSERGRGDQCRCRRGR